MSESRRVRSHLLNLECYVRDPKLVMDLGTKYPSKKYVELQRKTVQNGIVETPVEVDYLITPVSVASYRESTDYKSNPAQAAAVGAMNKRKNLGDVSKLQEIMQMDSTQLQLVASAYQRAMESVQKAIADAQAAKVAASQPVDGGKSE